MKVAGADCVEIGYLSQKSPSMIIFSLDYLWMQWYTQRAEFVLQLKLNDVSACEGVSIGDAVNEEDPNTRTRHGATQYVGQLSVPW